jgi:hypothetical protein
MAEISLRFYIVAIPLSPPAPVHLGRLGRGAQNGGRGGNGGALGYHHTLEQMKIGYVRTCVSASAVIILIICVSGSAEADSLNCGQTDTHAKIVRWGGQVDRAIAHAPLESQTLELVHSRAVHGVQARAVPHLGGRQSPCVSPCPPRRRQ